MVYNFYLMIGPLLSNIVIIIIIMRVYAGRDDEIFKLSRLYIHVVYTRTITTSSCWRMTIPVYGRPWRYKPGSGTPTNVCSKFEFRRKKKKQTKAYCQDVNVFNSIYDRVLGTIFTQGWWNVHNKFACKNTYAFIIIII